MTGRLEGRNVCARDLTPRERRAIAESSQDGAARRAGTARIPQFRHVPPPPGRRPSSECSRHIKIRNRRVRRRERREETSGCTSSELSHRLCRRSCAVRSSDGNNRLSISTAFRYLYAESRQCRSSAPPPLRLLCVSSVGENGRVAVRSRPTVLTSSLFPLSLSLASLVIAVFLAVPCSQFVAARIRSRFYTHRRRVGSSCVFR